MKKLQVFFKVSSISTVVDLKEHQILKSVNLL